MENLLVKSVMSALFVVSIIYIILYIVYKGKNIKRKKVRNMVKSISYLKHDVMGNATWESKPNRINGKAMVAVHYEVKLVGKDICKNWVVSIDVRTISDLEVYIFNQLVKSIDEFIDRDFGIKVGSHFIKSDGAGRTVFLSDETEELTKELTRDDKLRKLTEDGDLTIIASSVKSSRLFMHGNEIADLKKITFEHEVESLPTLKIDVVVK